MLDIGERHKDGIKEGKEDVGEHERWGVEYYPRCREKIQPEIAGIRILVWVVMVLD